MIKVLVLFSGFPGDIRLNSGNYSVASVYQDIIVQNVDYFTVVRRRNREAVDRFIVLHDSFDLEGNETHLRTSWSLFDEYPWVSIFLICISLDCSQIL